jgi:sphingolipid delta-4 desaturase
VQITKLMGREPLTKYLVAAVVALQLATAVALRHTSPTSWTFLLAAYVIGGTANQNLFLAIHEITHNLAFRGIRANRLLAVFANLPIGIPYAMLFKRYHIEVRRRFAQ